LLKEYKREVFLFIGNQRDGYPPMPENYFSAQAQAILTEYQEKVLKSIANQQAAPEFPEELVRSLLHNTWHDSGEAVINNWIGHVYQTTNNDRKKHFMDGIDPNDPLGIR
jgi:homoserine O-succinyltransferase